MALTFNAVRQIVKQNRCLREGVRSLPSFRLVCADCSRQTLVGILLPTNDGSFDGYSTITPIAVSYEARGIYVVDNYVASTSSSIND